jgi:hypothetical protein
MAWTTEQIDTLRSLIKIGKDPREAASSINKTYKTNYSRLAIIGKCNREGIKLGIRKLKADYNPGVFEKEGQRRRERATPVLERAAAACERMGGMAYIDNIYVIVDTRLYNIKQK